MVSDLGFYKIFEQNGTRKFTLSKGVDSCSLGDLRSTHCSSRLHYFCWLGCGSFSVWTQKKAPNCALLRNSIEKLCDEIRKFIKLLNSRQNVLVTEIDVVFLF